MENAQLNSNQAQGSKNVLLVTKDSEFSRKTQKLLTDFPDFKYQIYQEISLFLDIDPKQIDPFLFLIDGNLGQSDVQEWTQSLKMTFSKVPLIVFHTSKTPLNFKSIKKNGADLLVHMNFDHEFIIDLILENIPYDFPANKIPLAALEMISGKDLSPELEINFDIFIHLPFNKKTLTYRKKGRLVDERGLEKIHKNDQHLYFKKSDKKLFLEYARTAQSLSNQANPLVETERSLKTKKLIFEIMSVFFDQETTDFSGGKIIYERCKEIVTEYDLIRTYTPTDAFEKIISYTGQGRTFYNEAINLCLFSALFGHILGLSLEKVESLALAGLLHNIGLSFLDNFNLQDEISSLSDSQKIDYFQYPTRSVNMLKNKRVPLPPSVSDTILEHCENVDGSGFPNKLTSEKISDLGRIIRASREFQIMTALTKNSEKRTATSALKELKDLALNSKIPIDLNTVLGICKALKV